MRTITLSIVVFLLSLASLSAANPYGDMPTCAHACLNHAIGVSNCPKSGRCSCSGTGVEGAFRSCLIKDEPCSNDGDDSKIDTQWSKYCRDGGVPIDPAATRPTTMVTMTTDDPLSKRSHEKSTSSLSPTATTTGNGTQSTGRPRVPNGGDDKKKEEDHDSKSKNKFTQFFTNTWDKIDNLWEGSAAEHRASTWSVLGTAGVAVGMVLAL
ncbi:hypothetical protein M011DRAFT_477473 [Sporormia fimetaria CBS 119925]|uniref:CFEM domain-containing protein n=1 Tax=Sporormia fimetaria CBS 119925 TaxID=1340428 RepID=A0A6A6VCI0_9PLEO|nr:hypothetical protein M011DRAFT_477473 [Sporormia fimetaria CBS 119925]